VNAPVPLVTIISNTLENSLSIGISITVTETDQSLPLAVQNAFNLTGSNIAQGVQLDVLGKYAGVTRSYGSTILSDQDFLTVIQFAIAQNNSGSSLATIEQNLYNLFPGDFYLFDSQEMEITYFFNSSLVNTSILNIIINEGLIPRPMAVSAIVVVAPVISNFFGFRTYDSANAFAQPFNTYDSFNTNWNWLSYSNAYVA
jgi:hypothetical protein